MSARIAALLALAFTVVAGVVMVRDADMSHWCNDGATLRFQAKMLSIGAMTVPAPEEPQSFRVPMMIAKDGRWFGQYYPGYPLVLAAGTRVGLDWIVNPLFGGLLVFGAYLLGRRLSGGAAGVVAAGLLAVSPLLLKVATTYLSHVVCATFLVYATVALLNAIDRNDWRWGLVGGALFGWGVLARPYTGFLLAPTLFVALAAYARRSLPDAVRLAVAFGLAALPWGVAVFGWNLALTGDAFTSPYSLNWPLSGLGFHEVHPHAGIVGRMFSEYTPEIAWIATRKLLGSLNANFLPVWFPVPVLLLAAIPVAWRIGWRGAIAALFPVCIVAGHFFYQGITGAGALSLGPRYYSEALPFLAVLAAVPLAIVGARFRRVGVAMVVVLVWVMAVAAGVSVRETSAYVRSLHASPVSGANRILERHLAALGGGPRLVFVDISTYDRASAMLINRPRLDGPDVVAIYGKPAINRKVMDEFPGREALLMRWDAAAGGVVLTPYDPEADTEGPPDVGPYRQRRSGPRGGEEEDEG